MPDTQAAKTLLDFQSGMVLACSYGALGGFVYSLASLVDGGRNDRGEFEALKKIPWGLFLFGRTLVGLGGGIAALMVSIGMGRYDTPKSADELAVARLGLAALSFVAGFIAYRLLPAVAARLEEELAKTKRKLEDTDKKTDTLQDAIALNSDVGTAMEFLNLKEPPPGHQEQLIERLKEHRKRFPRHRRLNIVLARLYGEGKKDLDSAIEVLETFVSQKKAGGEGNDKDTADALFNAACYYSLKMGTTTGEARKTFEDKATNAITDSVKILPANALDIPKDNDLKNIRESGRLQSLLEKPLSNSN